VYEELLRVVRRRRRRLVRLDLRALGAVEQYEPPPRLRLAVDGLAVAQLGSEGEAVLRAEGGTPEIELKRGALHAYVRPSKGGVPAKPRFRIRTHAAVMGVRGTTLFVSSRDTDFVCVCHGDVEVVWGARKREIRSRRHDAPVTVPADAAHDLTPAREVVAHSDVDAAELAGFLH
jgi:hypothetical protein